MTSCCQICRSLEISVTDIHYGIDGKFDYARCYNCGFIQKCDVDSNLLKKLCRARSYLDVK